MKHLDLLIYLLLSIPLLVLNCSKNEFACKSNCLIIEGSVVDSYTGNAVKDGIVKIYLDPISLGTSSLIEKGQTTTDKNGNYEIKLEGNNLYKSRNNWVVKCMKNGFLSSRTEDAGTKISNIDSTNFDTPIEVNISLIPKATLKVNLNVTSSQQDFYYDLNYGNGWYRRNIWIGSYQSTMSEEVAGGRTTYIRYSKGVQIIGNDSLFINVGKVGEISFGN